MCQKENSSLVTIETLSGIKHTPGVTYPGAAAVLRKAPRVRVGIPRPRAAWTAAADTAAANAPLLYNTHTGFNQHREATAIPSVGLPQIDFWRKEIN